MKFSRGEVYQYRRLGRGQENVTLITTSEEKVLRGEANSGKVRDTMEMKGGRLDTTTYSTAIKGESMSGKLEQPGGKRGQKEGKSKSKCIAGHFHDRDSSLV